MRAELRCERDFSIWKYSVSHRQLLLRSVKGDTHETCIDVLLKGVNYIMCPHRLVGVVLIEPALEDEAFPHLAVADEEARRFVFRGKDREVLGCVDALSLWVEEDSKDYFDESRFFEDPLL